MVLSYSFFFNNSNDKFNFHTNHHIFLYTDHVSNVYVYHDTDNDPNTISNDISNIVAINIRNVYSNL